MHILFLSWDSYGKKDLIASFEALGHTVVQTNLAMGDYNHDPEFARNFRRVLTEQSFDCVFSSNYYPVVSGVCRSKKLRYISWIYDSPLITLYSRTASNECNYIFVFDRILYQELVDRGLKTVYYMPLGVNTRRLDQMVVTSAQKKQFSCDVAFVGSLYDNKNNLYDRMVKKGLPEKTKGYLDAIMEAQLHISDRFLLQEMITPAILQDMIATMEYLPPHGVDVSREYVYANYFLGHKTTSMERRRLLRAVSERFDTRIYTTCDTTDLPKLDNRGPVDYETQMPIVFANSRINLNMTLRTIQSGIPLRAMDIMGSGGFLLSNAQADFAPDFVPGEHYDCYHSEEELLEKIEYYLTHEKQRSEIAENAAQKIREEFTMEKLLERMLAIAF